MVGSNNNLPTQLPILEHKNWDKWCVQMRVLLKFQGVLDIVMFRYQEVSEGSLVVEIAAQIENEKKDCKALFLLHQSVDTTNFNKIIVATTMNEAWEILEKCHVGAEKAKKVKLQTKRRCYKLL